MVATSVYRAYCCLWNFMDRAYIRSMKVSLDCATCAWREQSLNGIVRRGFVGRMQAAFLSEPNVKVEFLDQSEKALVKFRAEVLGDLLECAVQFRLSDRFRFQIPFHSRASLRCQCAAHVLYPWRSSEVDSWPRCWGVAERPLSRFRHRSYFLTLTYSFM